MKKTYVGVGNASKSVSNLYVGVGGTARKVVKGYVGDSNGLSRLFFDADEDDGAIISFTGRKIYRHETLPGSVIKYNEFGVTKKLFVADAVHRFTKSWSKGNKVVPGLKRWEHRYTLTNSANTIDTFDGAVDKLYLVKDLTPYADQLTDAHFQAALAETLKPVLQTAKEATDLMRAAGDDYDLTWTLRYRSKSVGIETQLPNIYQLLVMYAEGDIIDSLDPTLASVGGYYLGMGRGYRFYVGAYSAWSSTEHSDSNAHAMRYGGNTYHYEKYRYDYGVIPVAEL